MSVPGRSSVFYQLPPTLEKELEALAILIEKTRQGAMDHAELRAHRVPFGVYEMG